VLLAIVAIVFTGLWIWLRSRIGPLFYIIAAGVLYGFVATLAKVVIERIKVGEVNWLTITCVAALIAAAIVGAYFVQSAYASGPPDLVVAGLTVVDPIVAIIIGLTILQEAAGAPLWVFIVFGVVGAIAVWGVFQLARHHPQVVSDSQELPIQRGSSGSGDAAHPRTGSIKVTEAVAKVWPEPPVKDRADSSDGRDR